MYACKKRRLEIHCRCSSGTVRFGRLNRLDVSRATDHDRSTYPSIYSTQRTYCIAEMRSGAIARRVLPRKWSDNMQRNRVLRELSPVNSDDRKENSHMCMHIHTYVWDGHARVLQPAHKSGFASCAPIVCHRHRVREDLVDAIPFGYNLSKRCNSRMHIIVFCSIVRFVRYGNCMWKSLVGNENDTFQWWFYYDLYKLIFLRVCWLCDKDAAPFE